MNDDEAIELLRKLFVQLMDAQRKGGAPTITLDRADAFNAVGLAFKYMEVLFFAKDGLTPSIDVGGVTLVRAVAGEP